MGIKRRAEGKVWRERRESWRMRRKKLGKGYEKEASAGVIA